MEIKDKDIPKNLKWHNENFKKASAVHDMVDEIYLEKDPIAASLKQRKKDRVFWELTKTRDGYAKHLSRHFNEKYLPAVGVWEKRIKVLYCTRHTFINALFQKNVDENIIKSVVGHEKEFTMKHYGGEPFSSERLHREIAKVTYSGIKWERLKLL